MFFPCFLSISGGLQVTPVAFREFTSITSRRRAWARCATPAMTLSASRGAVGEVFLSHGFCLFVFNVCFFCVCLMLFYVFCFKFQMDVLLFFGLWRFYGFVSAFFNGFLQIGNHHELVILINGNFRILKLRYCTI